MNCMSCGIESNSSKCHLCEQERFNDVRNSSLIVYITSNLALCFLILANTFPFVSTTQLGHQSTATILEGVIHFLYDGSYFVGLLILIASIILPTLKLYMLFYQLSLAKGSLSTNPRAIKIMEIMHALGKWSMVDIFVVVMLSYVFSVNNTINIEPEWGFHFFLLMVFLTLIANHYMKLILTIRNTQYKGFIPNEN